MLVGKSAFAHLVSMFLPTPSLLPQRMLNQGKESWAPKLIALRTRARAS